MKALLLHAPGPQAELSLEDIERPTPAADEVLIKVEAISINPVDVKVRDIAEVATAICGEARPLVLGWDIAGTVVEQGPGADGFDIGDRVFGMVDFPGVGNGYAELVRAPASQLARMPDHVSFEQAAATTLAALTAVQVLRGRVKEGDRVLVHAGSGGVGHFAIQLAKLMGAHVITTCSGRNRDFVLELGADEHIDYRTTAFDEVLSDVDMVIDALGGDNTLPSVKVTRDGGHVVSLPTADFTPETVQAAEARGIQLEWLLVASSGDDMTYLAGLLVEGRLRAHVSKTYPFTDMDAAHADIRSGRTVGKLVVHT